MKTPGGLQKQFDWSSKVDDSFEDYILLHDTTREGMRTLRLGELAAVVRIGYTSDPNLASHRSTLLDRSSRFRFATMIVITHSDQFE
jgi:hypothetical protein